MGDYIAIAVIVVILAAAITYIIRAKKTVQNALVVRTERAAVLVIAVALTTNKKIV